MSATPAPLEDVHPVQRRTLAVLCGAQVLGGLGVGAAVAVGGLLAAGVTGSEGAAGLAQTASVVGAALLALPLVRLTDRGGRRVGLSSGLGLAAVGAAMVVVGANQSLTVLLFAGLVLTGAASAAGLQARFAATDLAVERHRARDLSTVVWATTVGAVAGPNLADPAGRVALSLGLPELTGGYLLALLVLALASVLVLAGLHPDPLLTARDHAADRGQAHAPHPRLNHSLAVIRTLPRRHARTRCDRRRPHLHGRGDGDDPHPHAPRRRVPDRHRARAQRPHPRDVRASPRSSAWRATATAGARCSSSAPRCCSWRA